MEGLVIHAILRDLTPKLPRRTLGWVFPDEGSAAVWLEGLGNLVLRYRPPHPILTLEPERLEGDPKTPFQRLVATRARGRLVALEQHQLDRVVTLAFEGERGFVDTPPARLVFELTGRNANLILTDPEGRILGVDREVNRQINRYRELRPGLPYTPPPPYTKLDPRTLGPEDLQALLGQPLAQGLVQHVDGIGPNLARELARRAGLTPGTPVAPEHLELIHTALKDLVQDPLKSTHLGEALRQAWEQEKAEALRKPLLAALEKRRRTLEKRLEDYARALERLEDAERYRTWGHLLLAYPDRIPPHANTARLPGFEEGTWVEVPLDPALTPVQNAERYYARAKRLEALAERALELEPRTRAALAALETEIQHVRTAGLEALRERLRRDRAEARSRIGLRYTAPGGFEVWVGRNSKENDLLTRMARSMDVWMHAQGVPGSHVIVRSGGKPVPLEALLFAARLAAYHSKARGERNVPVDYTLKKHVWRPRKAAPGQVLYTQAKTLFVDAALPETLEEPLD
ncbi:Rqc2 family fibronectin-binding protein [Marinithermus hydrothermalis]|uniref:Rqc2 homolog RqcH n=1 Tax=Marinithermus hydrothermalis (strain DSM 14884 / JCM 11576 / T1) TaxID=869210 RepID=F2NLH6_MARHT|nr:NFACT family protein [Marinithermus hydrothermalis]AEB12075.1 Fibronectin-binding A domain protein [Marinithermus hydrothermalis DSM 14884]